MATMPVTTEAITELKIATYEYFFKPATNNIVLMAIMFPMTSEIKRGGYPFNESGIINFHIQRSVKIKLKIVRKPVNPETRSKRIAKHKNKIISFVIR